MKKNYLILVSCLIGSLIGAMNVSAKTIGPEPITPTPLSKGTIFVSHNGNGNACLKLSPCSIWTAISKAVSGDVVFLRGGTYTFTQSINIYSEGIAENPIIFENYPNETVIFDGNQHTKGTNIGIRIYGEFIQLRNIEIKNMPRQGLFISGSNNLVEGVHSHDNGLSGIQIDMERNPTTNAKIEGTGSNNIIRNSTAHHNFDQGTDSSIGFANGGNADGIAISNGANNRIENCRVYNNSDDGIDTWSSTNSYVGYSISHTNGFIADGNGMGIKAGGHPPSANTTVEHTLSYSNKSIGITYNTNVDAKFFYNTTWDNMAEGFFLGGNPTTPSTTIAEHNIAADANPKNGNGVLETDNSWQRSGTVTFISTDPASPNFLVPTSNSGFADIGAYVGVTLAQPDLVVTEVSYSHGIFKAKVKNQGSVATPTGVAIGVAYSVDGQNKTWGDVMGPLSPGGQPIEIGTRGGFYAIPAGTHTITAYVDDVNRIPESNETNNQLSQSINVTAADSTLLPDLVVTQVTYANGIFTATVKNQGSAATPTGVVIGVGYSVDGVGKTWGDTTNPLAPGQSVEIGTRGGSYFIPQGPHMIEAYVDDVNRMVEISESNNKLSKQVTIP